MFEYFHLLLFCPFLDGDRHFDKTTRKTVETDSSTKTDDVNIGESEADVSGSGKL